MPIDIRDPQLAERVRAACEHKHGVSRHELKRVYFRYGDSETECNLVLLRKQPLLGVLADSTANITTIYTEDL